MNDPASPSHPPSIFLRWIIRIGIALILLAALLILAAPMLVNSLVRPKVLVAINDGLLGEASIGNLRFSWLDGVTVEDLRISNPPGFAKEDALSIGRVHVNPSLTSLMSGRLFLKDDLRIENVRLNVEQNAAGDLNLARLVKEQPARTSKPASTPASDPRAATASNTTTVQGGVVLDDLVLSLKTPTLTAPAVMAPLHAEARVQSLDRPVTFAVRNSDQSLSVRVDAALGARLLADLDYAITPAFLAPLKTALASLGPVKKFDGDLSGKGHLTLGDANTSSGKGDLTFAINSLSLESTDDQGQKKLYDLHPGDTVLNFEFKPAEGKSDFVLNAKAPATGLSFKGQTDGAGFEGALRLGTDLSELSRRLPGIIPVEAGLRGKVDVSLPNDPTQRMAGKSACNG